MKSFAKCVYKNSLKFKLNLTQQDAFRKRCLSFSSFHTCKSKKKFDQLFLICLLIDSTSGGSLEHPFNIMTH